MERLNWFKRYFTESHAWRTVYAILLIHLLVYISKYAGIPTQKTILVLLTLVLFIPVIAIYRFLRRIWEFSSTNNFPNDAFTYELAKSIPNLIIAIIFAIPSVQALFKYGDAFPVTAQLLEFVYSYSIGFWLFFFMSRLINKKI